MRHLKLLGLALTAVLAFATVVAATATAEEKEPAGLLYLSGEEGPVTVKGSVVAAQAFKTLGLKSASISAAELSIEGEVGKGEGTHSTLGIWDYHFKLSKLGKIACSSENAKGEKAAKEIILIHFEAHHVSLETGAGKLVPGVLLALLEEEKSDVTVNCGGVKVRMLGATFFEAQGASSTADVSEVKVTPVLVLKCDKNDKQCAELLGKWAATATKKGGEKDEKVQCPLAIFIEVEEECTELTSASPIPVKFSKMVLVDF